MYFAADLPTFMRQILTWLKPEGTFATLYSAFRFDDGTPVEKLAKDHTDLADAPRELRLSYEAVDYTAAHYEHMRRKR